jgi:4'-phosphopantetheinyl transferase
VNVARPAAGTVIVDEDGLQPGVLPPGEVHVWRAPLDIPCDATLADRWLSPDERSRRDAFHFDAHRHRFVIGRLLLRRLAGEYLSCDPAGVTFVYGDRGKPRVAPDAAGRRLEFNVAHSDDRAMLAFAWNRPLGVDLERIRENVDVDALANLTLSPGERSSWARLVGPERRLAFFRAWARKEALIKAVGDGLAMDLLSFDVSVTPGQPPRLTRLDGGDARLAGAWWLSDIEADDGFVAAIATRPPPATLRITCLAADTRVGTGPEARRLLA